MTYNAFSVIPSLNVKSFSNRFAQIDNLFSRITGESPLTNAPAYDLLQTDKDSYVLTLSVPNYTEHEIEITVLNNQLTITGKPTVEPHQVTDENRYPKWIHKGIVKNEFSLSFNLNHRVNVQRTCMEGGQLTIEFVYDIPEEHKPRKVAIGFQQSPKERLKHSAS